MTGGKVETFKPEKLMAHPLNVRKRINADHVSMLADAAKDAGSKWIFPPVILTPIPVDARKEGGPEYYTLDGLHRTAAAKALGMDVQGTVRLGMNDAEILVLQAKENLHKGGLVLDFKARAEIIVGLKGLGVKGKQIAVETGLSESTVSRVISGKASVTGWDKKGNGKEDGKGDEKKKNPKRFDPEKWTKAVGKVLEGWKKYRKSISKSGGWTEKHSKALDAMDDAFAPEE